MLKNSTHERDGCELFGNYVASKLREYDRKTRAIVEYHISNILFKADMGKYDGYMDNTTTPSAEHDPLEC